MRYATRDPIPKTRDPRRVPAIDFAPCIARPGGCECCEHERKDEETALQWCELWDAPSRLNIKKR